MSLCQYLGLQHPATLHLLFTKHGMPEPILLRSAPQIEGVLPVVQGASPEQLSSLLGEVVRTQGDLRTSVSPRYVYDQRWDDLVACLLLDGYRVGKNEMVAIEPDIEGAHQPEDDLALELAASGLSAADEVSGMLAKSAEAFQRTTPDYNACLSNARVGLQTLAAAIAQARQATRPGSFDETKWGQVLAYLRTSNLVSQKEEGLLAQVYGLASEGPHSPIGEDQQEMARLARGLVISMCYLLVRRHNQAGAAPGWV